MTASLQDLTRARLAHEDQLARLANDLTMCTCRRCSKSWATNAGPVDNFTLVTMFCPDCLAGLPRMPEWMLR